MVSHDCRARARFERRAPGPDMSLPIKLISTDFDGTLHSDFEFPPVPRELEHLIGSLQKQGVAWIINTGRDLSNLMEGIARAQLSIHPDFVVVVEREIYEHRDAQYIGVEDWNTGCAEAHADVFQTIRPALPEIIQWVQSRFEATIYEDPYSPFCLIAQNRSDAEAIHDYLAIRAQGFSDLTVVRNDIYARFSHKAYNKGSALAEVARRLGVSRDFILAAGDHYNDLPMLSSEYARWLVAPSNAIPEVKETVRRQNGFVSLEPAGSGVARGLEFLLKTGSFAQPG